MVNSMWRSGFPAAGNISAGSLAGNVPSQTPFFLASNQRPELVAFLVAGIGAEALRYGQPFQLLTFCGYLCRSRERADLLEMRLDTSSGRGALQAGQPCHWKLLPHTTFYTSFAPGSCLAHSPNPSSLLALSCAPAGRQWCTATGRRVYFSGEECQKEGEDEASG